MAKSIKELKKENTFLKSKCEKSDFTLIELVEEVSWRACSRFHFLLIISLFFDINYVSSLRPQFLFLGIGWLLWIHSQPVPPKGQFWLSHCILFTRIHLYCFTLKKKKNVVNHGTRQSCAFFSSCSWDPFSHYQVNIVLRLLFFAQAAWTNEETAGEIQESERKTWITVPITSGRKETKFRGKQQLRFSSRINTNRYNHQVWILRRIL